MQAANSGVFVSLASAIASVNNNAATLAEVPFVNPFCSGFYKASNSEKADSSSYFSSTFPLSLVTQQTFSKVSITKDLTFSQCEENKTAMIEIRKEYEERVNNGEKKH